jgi:hypothetical protein
VGHSISDGFSLFFIFVSGVMYKFFIDEGVLFWDESQIDPKEDLCDGESYIDLMSSFDIPTSNDIKKIKMSNGKLRLHFTDVGLELTNKDELTFIEKI